MKYKQKKYLYILLPICIFIQSCGVYSFTGGSIPPEMKTVSIPFFDNTAPLVVPYLSQQFTEALKERVRNQSRLSLIRTEADANFEGRITDYSIRPAGIEAETQRAALNRLSITVSVKFTSTVKPELGFEQSFTRYADFQGSITNSNEQRFIKEVNTQLTEDIYNRAFANW